MSEELVALSRAFHFAARRHEQQRRKGQRAEPYLNHLAEVTSLLAESTAGNDSVLLIAGLLHDTVEDTDTTPSEIEDLFGAEVATLVAEVTDDKKLPKQVRKRLQVEKVRKKSERARLLKIADKTSNLRALVSSPPEDWSSERILEYVAWARQVVDGCRGLNSQLERAFDTALQQAGESLGCAKEGWERDIDP